MLAFFVTEFRNLLIERRNDDGIFPEAWKVGVK